LKPAPANSSRDPISKKKKKNHKKRAGGVAQGVDPEFKPQHQKKKRKFHKEACVTEDLVKKRTAVEDILS
jgi:hypothetical protein